MRSVATHKSSGCALAVAHLGGQTTRSYDDDGPDDPLGSVVINQFSGEAAEDREPMDR